MLLAFKLRKMAKCALVFACHLQHRWQGFINLASEVTLLIPGHSLSLPFVDCEVAMNPRRRHTRRRERADPPGLSKKLLRRSNRRSAPSLLVGSKLQVAYAVLVNGKKGNYVVCPM